MIRITELSQSISGNRRLSGIQSSGFSFSTHSHSSFVTCRSEILGTCKLTDLVFCHYRHKTAEVRVIALPRRRKLSKAEVRDRHLQCFSFFSPSKTTSIQEIIPNPTFYIYKYLHDAIVTELERNTEEIIRMNKRLLSGEEDIAQLRKHLAVNPSKSILGRLALKFCNHPVSRTSESGYT